MLKLAVAVVKLDLIWSLLLKHIEHRHNGGYFTSLPVIRKENDMYYLACFVSDLSTVKTVNNKKYIKRPSEWVSASLQRGDELVYNYCVSIDFCNRSIDEYLPVYSLNRGNAVDMVEKCLIEIGGIQTRIYSEKPYSMTDFNTMINVNVNDYYKPYYIALGGDLIE